MAALGKHGLSQVAQLCYHKAHYAAQSIAELDGYAVNPATPFFKEFAVQCPRPVAEINERLLEDYGIVGGYDLGRAYPDLDAHMLLCVTEMNTASQIKELVEALEEVAA